MPRIDGFQTLEAIKANPELRHIPIIIHSGRCDDDCVSKCYELGASLFLQKANSYNGLRSGLAYALAKDWLDEKLSREDFLYQP